MTPDDGSGRDSRLLALIIVIAIAVLVGLARFRFPASVPHPVPVTPGPLERLAARATFDDLAAAVQTTLQRVEAALMIVPVEAAAPQTKSPQSERLVVAAVRVSDEWAIAYVPSGLKIARTSPDDALVIREVDAAKEIAIVSRPLGAAEDHLPTGYGELTGFSYLCVVEPTPDGPTASPMFVGRIRTVMDARWGSTVMAPAGSTSLPPGSAIFQIDGRFLGIVFPQASGGTALVPAALLEAAVAAARGRSGGGK